MVPSRTGLRAALRARNRRSRRRAGTYLPPSASELVSEPWSSALCLPAPGWIAVVAVAMAIATWEVTKRLREADIEVPRIPLLVGGQATIWLGWPLGPVGVLSGFTGNRPGLHGVAAVATTGSGNPEELPGRHLRHGVPSGVDPAAGVVRCVDGAQDDGPGRVFVLMIGVVCSDIGGYIGRCAVREAPDGAGHQPEEVLGRVSPAPSFSASSAVCFR